MVLTLSPFGLPGAGHGEYILVHHRRPAAGTALCLGCFQPGPRAVLDERALELRHGRDDLEEQAAIGRRGVDRRRAHCGRNR